MRRVLTSLVALSLLLLVAVPVASAGKFVTPQKADWFYTPSGSSDNVTTDQAYGHVQVVDPMGTATFIVNGVLQLEPNTSYAVWVRDLQTYSGPSFTSAPQLGYFKLGYVVTDALGYGSFNIKTFTNFLQPGDYHIQIAINADPGTDPSFIGTTVIATGWVPGLTVSVHS